MRRTILPLLFCALPLALCATTYTGASVNLEFAPDITVGRKAFLAGVASLYLPQIADALGVPFDGTTPIVIHRTNDPKAAPGVTCGRTITYNEPYLRRMTDDAGMFVHELTHVVQAYPGGTTPVWLTEGITDYLRDYILLPEPTRWADPATADYRKGYTHAARLLDHIIRTRHHGDAKALLHPLNAVCRKGEDGAAWLVKTYGDLDALTEELRKTARKAP